MDREFPTVIPDIPTKNKSVEWVAGFHREGVPAWL